MGVSEKEGGTKKDLQFSGLNNWKHGSERGGEIQEQVESQLLRRNGQVGRFVNRVKCIRKPSYGSISKGTK